MEGSIYISGQIGRVGGMPGVELVDVISQVQKQGEATSFNVYINSDGGYVQVGIDIYNYLKSLEVPINTIGVGVVASIATVIFMAGSKRTLRKGAEFMIHLPAGKAQGTSEDFKQYIEVMEKAEKQILSIYKAETGLSDEALLPLLKNETWMDAETALSMKFTTEAEIEFALVAKALYNLNTNTNMTAEDKGWFEGLFNNLFKKFEKPTNIILQDANGQEVEFPTVEDGQNPQIGDTALLGGQPIPDGDYVMPSLDGVTVRFVGGVITEIMTPDGVLTEEEANALKAENEALKTQLSELQASLQTEKTQAEAKVNQLKEELVNFKNEVSGKFEFDGKKDPKKKEGEPVNLAQERLAKLKTRK
jgi:ATP-dependent Clp protease, protease subunit